MLYHFSGEASRSYHVIVGLEIDSRSYRATGVVAAAVVGAPTLADTGISFCHDISVLQVIPRAMIHPVYRNLLFGFQCTGICRCLVSICY